MQSQIVQEPHPLSERIANSQFLFVACQQGTEDALKNAWIHAESGLALAFSRPGLLTFKFRSPLMTVPEHTLARLAGWSLGQVRAESGQTSGLAEDLVKRAFQLSGSDWDAIHVFERDQGVPGFGGFEPGSTPLSESVGELFRAELKAASGNHAKVDVNQTAALGSRVLDIIVVQPDQWLLGCHLANQRHECWPGGVYPQPRHQPVISRAYYKIAEALAWSGLPIRAGDEIVELGSSPGGACQRLLDLGLRVTGVDPAEMDTNLLGHPNFEHWRSKSAGLKRKWFSKFRWLAADANVAPNYTLDMVEDIVTYPGNQVEGMLLTFKLSSYALLENFPAVFERIRSWGYQRIEARQLATNRQECVVVAERSPVGR